MKKFTFLAISLAFALFLLSNTDRTPSMNFVYSAIEEEPVLPSFPFKYRVDLPLHIREVPDVPPPYYPVEPDTALIEHVTNHGATLGRVLFYDKKLSALEDISCASCHLASQSFADNKDFSQGVNTLTSRNSMHLNDLGWTKNKGFFWDFREDDLHHAINLPLTDANEIGADVDDIALKLANTSYYPALFNKAYGSQEVNIDKITDALVQFIASMNTFNSKFDKAIANNFLNFSPSEMRGRDLFGNECATCHTEGSGIGSFGGLNLTLQQSIQFFPNMLANGLDTEPEDIGVGSWMSGMDGLFKAPTLRNIELTGPYMHDGRFETLDDVIDFYSEDVVDDGWSSNIIPAGGYQFTNQEKTDLKAFLLTLTDHTVALNPKWQNPFSIVSNTEELDVDVKIMPNPMHLYSEVLVENPTGSRVDVNITDAMGRIIKTDYFNSSKYTIQKGDFTPGVYYISLTMNKKLATYKLIVQ